MDFTNYLRDAIINFWLRADPDSLTAPATVYLSLYTVAPTASTAGAEVSNASYSPQAMSWVDPASTGDSNQQADLSFSFPTGIADTDIVAVGVGDSVSTGDGNLLMFDTLAGTLTVSAGQTLTWSAGDITLEVR